MTDVKPQDHWTVVGAIKAARALIKAADDLSFAAQITGGTAGRDEALCLAVIHWAAERDKQKQVLRIIELEGHDPEVGVGYELCPMPKPQADHSEDILHMVTPRDREAYLSLNMLPPEDADAVRAGKWDGVTGVQAFARHRLDHTAPAEPVLRWEGDMLCVGGVKVGEVWRAIHQFGWVVSLDAKEVQGFAPNKAEARAAAEQAVKDWLKSAGCV